MDLSHLKDLYAHMEWADSTIWTGVLGAQNARSADQILDTLFHIHETQHAFLNVWLEQPFQRRSRGEFVGPEDVSAWGQSFYPSVDQFLESLSPPDLEREPEVPWSKYFARYTGSEPTAATLGETLYQVVSHSMHHRGQAASGFSLLEGKAPATDFIVWVWLGRPKADWPL